MAEEFNLDGMVDIYIYENGQLLEKLEEIVLETKDDDAFDENSINEIFRIMHTIKGSSGVMMYDNIMKVSHKTGGYILSFEREYWCQRTSYGAYGYCIPGFGFYQW